MPLFGSSVWRPEDERASENRAALGRLNRTNPATRRDGRERAPPPAQELLAVSYNMSFSSEESASDPTAGTSGLRRPRIAIMGEFSAGKSTLTNLLLGESALPTRITATQLPPVWLSYGDDAAYGETVDGTQFAIDLEAFGSEDQGTAPHQARPVDVATTKYMRIFRRTDVLEMCDLIDFPGISDPNMDPDVWQRVLPMADAVLWCTHATQAWRQSEAAVWEDLPEDLHRNSLLLLTRIDRVTDERDRRRVIARVTRETDGLFAGVFPVSLLKAQAAGEDQDVWAESGAEDMTQALFSVITGVARDLGHDVPHSPMPKATMWEEPRQSPAVAETPVEPDTPVDDTARIRPRRVRPTLARSSRPTPEAGQGSADGSFSPPPQL